MIAAVLALGLVVGDGATLRAAPRDSAPLSAQLAPGDALELRGARGGFMQVYDHRRERGGYVRESALREVGAAPEDAPALLAVVRFVRDTPGQESLGIGYCAAFLRAAKPADIGPEIFDALGTLSERLGRRASHRSGQADDAKLALQLDAASSYGVHFNSVEHDGRVELCYDGEAYRRVLALGGTPEQNARAALGLTRPECVDSQLTPPARAELDAWRGGILAKVETEKLPVWISARVHLRRAAIHASMAFSAARTNDLASSQRAGDTALSELAKVNKADLADDDLSSYADAAERVGASRWAAERDVPRTGGLVLTLRNGEPGETCLQLRHLKSPELLVERCTHGVVWANSARAAPRDRALTISIQPTDSWRELWVFHEAATGWVAEILTPAASEPAVGYVELAGFSPDGSELLTAREARAPGHKEREFAVLDLQTLATLKRADHPEAISVFHRWQAPEWRAATLALR